MRPRGAPIRAWRADPRVARRSARRRHGGTPFDARIGFHLHARWVGTIGTVAVGAVPEVRAVDTDDAGTPEPGARDAVRRVRRDRLDEPSAVSGTDEHRVAGTTTGNRAAQHIRAVDHSLVPSGTIRVFVCSLVSGA